MATYRATIDWSLKDGEDFANGRYSRGHTVSFEEHVVPATASKHVVWYLRYQVEGLTRDHDRPPRGGASRRD